MVSLERRRQAGAGSSCSPDIISAYIRASRSWSVIAQNGSCANSRLTERGRFQSSPSLPAFGVPRMPVPLNWSSDLGPTAPFANSGAHRRRPETSQRCSPRAPLELLAQRFVVGAAVPWLGTSRTEVLLWDLGCSRPPSAIGQRMAVKLRHNEFWPLRQREPIV